MKEALIPFVPGSKDWSAIPCLSIDTPLRPTDAKVSANAQICYDDEALYIHLSTTEEEHRSVEKGPLGMPCEDSCLEFFFCPEEGDTRYFNFEFNSNPCLFLGIATNIQDLTRLVTIRESDMFDIFQPATNVRPDGWDITFRMPYTYIRRFFPDFAPASGKTMRANFYKCAEKVEKPHFLTWNPILRQGRHLFHTQAEFGKLIFE